MKDENILPSLINENRLIKKMLINAMNSPDQERSGHETKFV